MEGQTEKQESNLEEKEMKAKFVKTCRDWAPAIKLASVMVMATLNIQAQGSFDLPAKWSDFLCVGQEVCAVGDFNADGFDDVAAFVRNTKTGAGQGDVYVALSNGSSFGAAQKWSDFLCVGQEVCAVGDFNGDFRDDVMAFVRDTKTGDARGDAYVALSTGTGFSPAQKWSDLICVGQEVCKVGDFNGDSRADVVAFVRNTQIGVGRGDAYVALSTGTGFAPAQKWNDSICIGQEVCEVVDFDGNGRDDLIAFVRNTRPGIGRGDAYVAFSTGSAFEPAQKRSDFICIGQEMCAVGNFNGSLVERRDDAVAFVRNTKTGAGQADVFVAISGPSGFAQPQNGATSFASARRYVR
jgi:hypothetical protein